MEALKEKILKDAETSRVIVFFDMDGVCAEYGSEDVAGIKNNEPGLFLKKRPIKSVIATMRELSENENIQVKILSNCNYLEQKQDKLTWLTTHADFIKPENINIILLKEETYDEDTKDFIKCRRIKKILADTHEEDSKVYLIEDDHGIINATNKDATVKAEHISTLLN